MGYWLDVDTGIDDAVALLAAAGAVPAGGWAWVSAVAGNVGLDAVVDNTLRVLAAAGRDEVPVFRGADRPLVRRRVDAAYAHGESGLGGVALPPPRRAPEGDLLALAARLAEVPDGSLTLVATGPLTNIALLCRLAPDLVRRKVARTVWMGGGRGRGNVTAAAEFNAYADPEAAAVVLEALAPVAVVDLVATHAAHLTPDEVRGLARLGSRGALACALLEDPAYGGARAGGVVVHDAVALLAAIHPGELFEFRPAPVEVDLSRGPSYGATLAGPKVHGPEALWPTAPDRERFAALLAAALA
jgi:inosine-uridine nucleoside N-ribohydrolase